LKVKRYVAAVDLGASSGRVSAVSFDGDKVNLELANRFSNGAVSIAGHLYWDIGHLYGGLKEGIALASRIAASETSKLSSIAVDSWAVDYGFVIPDGPLLSLPHHHRDDRTLRTQRELFARWNPFELYQRSGIALHRFNTLYQLMAEDRSIFDLTALRALLIPDLLNYFMTNEIATEATNFSTTQLMMTTGDLDSVLFDELGIGSCLFGEIVMEGSLRGYLTEDLSSELNLASLPVHSVASHDTASAVLAVPFERRVPTTGANSAADKSSLSVYISSGTWSLVGVEVDSPIVTIEAFDSGYTNELGAFGRYRFLKNVMGLWLLSETLRDFEIDPSGFDLDELIASASSVEAFASLIDAASDEFIGIGSMAGRITAQAERLGYEAPRSIAEFARCIFDSLAIAYANTIAEIEELTQRSIEVIHIVGGGSQNRLLCQLTADATGKVVVAGPVEAAALGNGLMQLIALGDVPRDIDVVRSIVADSFDVVTYDPDRKGYERFAEYVGRFRSPKD
jgi:rhamnulokinase